MKTHMEELLSGYADGELHGTERARVEQHLRECAACSEELAALERLKAHLAENKPSVTMEETPEFFWSQVRRRIEHEPPKPSAREHAAGWAASGVWWRRLGFATAAALVVAALGIIGFQLTRSSPQAPEAFVKIDRATTDVPNATVEISQSSIPGIQVVSIPESYVEVEQVSTEVPNASVAAIQSAAAGVTVIWISGLENTHDGDGSREL